MEIKKMKHFIKMGVLGFALSLSLTACEYQKYDEILKLSDNQRNIALVLGDSHVSYIYNVKTPQDVYLYAPTGFKVLIGNEKQEYYKKHINPQETINLKFKILKDGEDVKNAEEVDKIVVTFKENFKPSYQREVISEGKYKYVEGDTNYFRMSDKQKDTQIELNEYNKHEIHKFYYYSVKNDIRIKLIAPKYQSFIFNGKPIKEYSFDMSKESKKEFSMFLKPDYSDETYRRQYYFKTKN